MKKQYGDPEDTTHEESSVRKISSPSDLSNNGTATEGSPESIANSLFNS